ncbi:hypothetical protein ACQI4L_24660 [Mycolicibacterium litorale]|uniref:hypothetical protein n=1 Tax=Mycolicibacterium litorale TaxID=758802 RepID=UPI003CE6D0EA
MTPERISFPEDRAALAVDVTDPADVAPSLEALGLHPPRPAVVIVGGAGGLAPADVQRLRPLFVTGIAPPLEEHQAAAIDGGTRSGIMRLAGETRTALSASFPLIGVAAAGTVLRPGRAAASDDAAQLEPNHTHFLLVPGDSWGAESVWIARTAAALSAGATSATVLINGGSIAVDDVAHSIDAGRRVVVVAGSGRTADAFADALAGAGTDRRVHALAASGLISAVPADEPAKLAQALADVLGAGP